MFRIKVCGITSVDDALAVAAAGADAVGLNFYRRSPRWVSRDAACEIAAAVPRGVVKVGVIVDTPAAEVCEMFDALSLDLIQLHGEQPPEFVVQLGHRPAMRAFRAGPDGLPMVVAYLHRCVELATQLELVMVDSLVTGEYGGSGKIADWSVARRFCDEIGTPPLVLAGGLTAENVGAAVVAVRPAAVDVASGVESRPGRKDPTAVASFVEAARTAFEHYAAWGLPRLSCQRNRAAAFAEHARRSSPIPRALPPRRKRSYDRRLFGAQSYHRPRRSRGVTSRCEVALQSC